MQRWHDPLLSPSPQAFSPQDADRPRVMGQLFARLSPPDPGHLHRPSPPLISPPLPSPFCASPAHYHHSYILHSLPFCNLFHFAIIVFVSHLYQSLSCSHSFVIPSTLALVLRISYFRRCSILFVSTIPTYILCPFHRPTHVLASSDPPTHILPVSSPNSCVVSLSSSHSAFLHLIVILLC